MEYGSAVPETKSNLSFYTIMEIIIIFFLILLNGFFALSEVAMISVKRSRIEQKAAKGKKNAVIVLDLLKNPENFLSSVQVGITLIGIVSGAYGGRALADDLEPLVAGFPFLAPYADSISLVIIVGGIMYFSIVLGELIPKTIALKNAENIALAVAPFLKLFTAIAYPVVKLLSLSTNGILRLLGIKNKGEDQLTEEELRQLIRSAGKQGILEREESQMHQNIFFFSDLKAKNLMTHRSAVEWIDTEKPLDESEQQIQESNFSKFPACAGKLDNIKGIITAKKFYEKRLHSDLSLESVLEEPLIIPEGMLAVEMLKLFRERKQYISIVVDEFGSFEGIVTLHDLIESILGDLPEAGEEENDEFLKREEGSYLVSGSIMIHHLNSKLDEELIEERTDSYTTLGGFILFFLNKIPNTGERFEYRNYSFEVLDLDGPRIDKVLVQKEKNMTGSNMD